MVDGVLAVDPDYPPAHAEAACLLMNQGKFAKGRLEVELAIALDPNYA
jgi:Tfp pilus assembly protein PilF